MSDVAGEQVEVYCEYGLKICDYTVSNNPDVCELRGGVLHVGRNVIDYLVRVSDKRIEAAAVRAYDIYIGGYSCTGASGVARLVASEVEAESFKDACVKHYARDDVDDSTFNADKLTDWACKLCDNLKDAQKGYG